MELNGKPFKIQRPANCDDNLDEHKQRLIEMAVAVGIENPAITDTLNEHGKGPAKHVIEIAGTITDGVSYVVDKIAQKDNTVRPPAP